MHSSRTLLASLPLFVLGTFVGCGGGAANGTAGGGPTGPTDPSEIVPEPLGGDPGASCPGAYAASAPVEGVNRDFEVAGQSREFLLITPPPSFEGPRPLLVAFNGTGETGPSFASRAQLDRFAERGFIVLAPSSAANGTIWPVWDSFRERGYDESQNRDLAYFDTLVACAGAHLSVDKHRIYAGGHSAGGIMTNYLLQRRSALLAGGIVGSGVHSLTGPEEPAALDAMLAIVTWGGDNDRYTGSAAGVSVPSINFVEQASIASVFYDAEPSVHQAHCRGDDLGHAWLSPLNDWFVDALLLHPKGIVRDKASLPALPSEPRASCSTDPFVFVNDVVVECPATSQVAGCSDVCQFFGDCAVENATVGPILAPELSALGFSGPDNADCTGCVQRCDEVATTAADQGVLACMREEQQASICGPGIEGAMPVVDAVNTCCAGRSDSPYCVEVCRILLGGTAAGFATGCQGVR